MYIYDCAQIAVASLGFYLDPYRSLLTAWITRSSTCSLFVIPLAILVLAVSSLKIASFTIACSGCGGLKLVS